MTTTKTTASTFRAILFFVLGLALSAFGVFHSVTDYPGPAVFFRFTHELPMLGAVASFAVGIVAAVAGLALLVPALVRLRRRQQPQSLPVPGSRSPYADRVPDFRPGQVRHDDDDYAFDPEGCEGDDQGGTGSGYGGAYGGGTGGYGGNGGYGGQGGRQRDNGNYDPRRAGVPR